MTAAPSQHFSGRGLNNRNSTLWSSLVIRSPRHAVFFSGDTGLTTEYQAIRERLGPFDLVMLEVGALHPSWGDMHLGPQNALEALALLGGGAFLPIHWGTFSLAMHAWDQPAEVLLELGPKGAQLVMPRLGEPVEPAHADARRAVVARRRHGCPDQRRPKPPRCRRRCPGRWTSGRLFLAPLQQRYPARGRGTGPRPKAGIPLSAAPACAPCARRCRRLPVCRSCCASIFCEMPANRPFQVGKA